MRDAAPRPALVEVDWIDRTRLLELLALYRNEWWTKDRTFEEVREMLARSDVVLGLVDPDDGKLVAFARALTDGRVKALVLDVIVHPAYRAYGIGKRLLDALLARPSIAGARHVELYCLPALVPFYERLGFAPTAPLVLLRRERPAPETPERPGR